MLTEVVTRAAVNRLYMKKEKGTKVSTLVPSKDGRLLTYYFPDESRASNFPGQLGTLGSLML